MEQARAAHIAETERLAGEGPRGRARRGRRRPPASPRPGLRRPRARAGRSPTCTAAAGCWATSSPSTPSAARWRTRRGRASSASTTGSRPSTRSRRRSRTRSTATRAVEADVVAGDSAGGNLAAVVARHLHDQLKLQLLVYPVTDAGLNTRPTREFDERFGLTAASMRRFWKLYLDGADGLHPDASPLRAEDLSGRSRPPTSSPPATTSCATRARPTRPRSSAQACRSRCTASRARSTASGAGRRRRSRATAVRDAAPRSAPR